MGLTSNLPPGLAVARELLDTVLDGPRLLWRVPAYWAEEDAERAAIEADLAAPAPRVASAEVPPRERWPDRPLHLFVSWAEASGELHAANLVRALRAQAERAGAPPPRFSALGSERGAAELGLELVGRPAERATMGIASAARALPYYLALLRDAAQHLRAERPDAFVPVDSPGLHMPLGRIARGYGVPVAHFVTPQLWGWAPWRIGRYRRSVDRALSILPFEPAWFARRGVRTVHVGHPILDELEGVPSAAPGPESRLLVLLPGSRRSIVLRNLPWMLARVRELASAEPELEVALPHPPELTELVRTIIADTSPDLAGRIELAPGELHAILARARAGFSVSGTVLLDLVHHRLPAVVVYQLEGRLAAKIAPRALLTPWFAVPNLLADREVLPEFAFAGRGPAEAVARALGRCYNDPDWRRRCSEGLALAAGRLGPPGATRRAAAAVLRMALSAPESP